MSAESEEFLKRLLATFQVEAEEHVGSIFASLLALEKDRSAEERRDVLETAYRAAHSLKGAARAVNASDIEGVCQKIESAFARLKRGEVTSSPEFLDALHRSVDLIRNLLSSLGAGRSGIDQQQDHVLGEELAAFSREATPSTEGTHAPPTLSPADVTTRVSEETSLPLTVRVATERLDSLLLQVEELLSAKQAVAVHSRKIRGLHNSFALWQKRWGTIQRDMRALESSLSHVSDFKCSGPRPEIRRFMEFVEWNEGFIDSIKEDFAELERPFDRDRRALGAMLDNLLHDMKQVVMLPFSSLQNFLLKVVRDLARDQQKEVNFDMEGAAVEVDRRILELMKDPLIHLVRNCVDHGIESPAVREARGKPRRGHVNLAISRSNSTKVEIRISDDGAGISADELRNAAVNAGILEQEEARSLSDEKTLLLIFRSGISTSQMLTNISGRGLGLAIVQENVEKLGGNISVKSSPGFGTTFLITIPVTLSTFRAVTISVAEQLFVVPTGHMDAVVRVRASDIKSAGNQQTISRNGETVALVHLNEVLGMEESAKEKQPEILTAFLIDFADQRIAFAVDSVHQEQEVLLKDLGKQLQRVRNIAGVTLLGAGKVVPVLNVVDLMKSATRAPSRSLSTSASREQPSVKKSILVVDDSITSRTLLKNILEANGYTVQTAVDGVDGFTRLRSAEFSLVVSDVEMPRMNGFDLTARVRADKRLSELPVILVTALGSQEDRERGIDAGANAYIVKTNFDQSNLLEAIRRLI